MRISAPIPMHGKKSKIKIDNTHKLFKGLEKEIEVMRYHSLMGERKTLPENLTIIGETQDEIIMAISHKKHNTFGVQFHPESIGTWRGKKILQNFLKTSL